MDENMNAPFTLYDHQKKLNQLKVLILQLFRRN